MRMHSAPGFAGRSRGNQDGRNGCGFTDGGVAAPAPGRAILLTVMSWPPRSRCLSFAYLDAGRPCHAALVEPGDVTADEFID